MNRWRAETAVTYAALGFLAGLIVGLAACEPQHAPEPRTFTGSHVWDPKK